MEWPPIRAILRDTAAIGVGVYVAIRAAEPPIDVADLPAFTIAAGFLGLPLVARNVEDGDSK